eukprot:915787-Rhodomonas_salina.1
MRCRRRERRGREGREKGSASERGAMKGNELRASHAANKDNEKTVWPQGNDVESSVTASFLMVALADRSLLSDATALRMQTTLMYLEGTVRSPERGAACRLFGCSTCESGSDLAPQETPYSTPKEKNPLSPSEHEHRFS